MTMGLSGHAARERKKVGMRGTPADTAAERGDLCLRAWVRARAPARVFVLWGERSRACKL